jgi:hypothetical protein
MASTVITLKAGETLSVMAVPADPLGTWGPGDPRPTNPIAGFDPIHGTFPDRPGGGLGFWGPGDPRPTNPIAGFDPAHGTWPDKPPPTQPPSGDEGNWSWAWSPQQGRWMWVRLPGEGEAGPK